MVAMPLHDGMSRHDLREIHTMAQMLAAQSDILRLEGDMQSAQDLRNRAEFYRTILRD